MRILIVDDDQTRNEVFRKRYRGQDASIVRMYSDAIRRLATGAKYDLISLDYDISEKEPGNVEYTGKRKTGLDIAKYIAENLAGTPRAPTRVIVHSHNAMRAPQIQDVLEQAGIRTEYTPYKE